MLKLLKSLKKGLFCLIAVAMLAASALMFAPVANAAQADFCGKVWHTEWDYYGLPLHSDVAICPNKIVISGMSWNNEDGIIWPEGSFTITGLTWEEIDVSEDGELDPGYTTGYVVRGTVTEIAGEAALWTGYWRPVLDEGYELFIALHESGESIYVGGSDHVLAGVYDCPIPPTTPIERPAERNPKTGDIDVVTMIATSALAILAIAGSVLVLKKQRA